MSTLFITYQDVCKTIREKKEQSKLEGLHKQKNFDAAFQLIFKFKDYKMAGILLNNWEEAIIAEIKNCENFNLITDKESYQIKRISLKELTTIANLGRYCVETLKMKSHIAMAFSLGLYYATFIFEGTGMYLTIDEIYNIIPQHKRTKNGYKVFLKRFFMDGTSKEILRILQQTKVV
tara:strand:+ start:336 stop:866 length:531 start_codon:yes stop_codon:yes gene_type:complete